ncbi:MAG: hypothetical protein K0R51_3068 [Cytophagaceae bacterium]|jgi:DNA-binding NarL/FixJ family response regulator|nr:hypothetical protein [Cytophagaceae bacterium]
MKTRILVIGRHVQILEVVVRLINQNSDWEAVGTDDEEALSLFAQHTFDLVLLSSGIEEKTENRLREAFTLQNPEIIILQHYGGGSGLLTGEIRQALENRK